MKNTFSSISTASQIVFIDSGVTDYQTLAAGVVSNTEVIIIEPNQDGIEQITTALSQKPYSTVHIVSHGSPGCLNLGNSQLSLDTLAKYTKELKTWFSNSSLIPHPLSWSLSVSRSASLSVSRSASLLIYGCNVAAGDAGEEFVAKLSNLTDAEIAASTTRIGNVAQGGNWELDVNNHSTNNNLAFTKATQKSYSGVFATYNNATTETVTAGNTVTKTFNVTENVIINDVNLGLNLNHSYRGDLRVTLTSPTGTPVEIISSSTDVLNNYDLFLTDLSTNSINSGFDEITTAPIYQEDYLAAPSNPFSAFDGENSTGTWTLTIDNLSGTNSNGRPLTFNSSRLGINAPPWNPNPNNGGILVRGAAFISCGTITDNGLDSPVLAVDRVDIDANGNPVIPASGEATVANPLTWSHQDWTQEKLGNVYGLDIDNQGNMYAAASANYGAGFGFGTDTDSATAQINYGSIGGSLADGQGGKTDNSSVPAVEADELAAAGTIYKMDAVTGAPTVFAVLPQQSTTVTNIAAESGDPDIVRNNSGVGLGNIHHDKINDQFFVSNFEDGRIYRLDTNGNILDSYDPGTLDDRNAGVVPIDELVYGLTVSPDGSQLFFGRNRTVYSVDLNSDGSFPGIVNNSTNSTSYTWDNYTGATETSHSTIPNDLTSIFSVTNLDIIISDLDFLPTGELVVGGRMYAEDNIFSSYNHGGHNYILEDTTTPGLYDVQTEIVGFSTSTQFGGDDGYGGVTYSKQLDDSFNYVFSSSDIIEEQGPHGLAVFPDNYTVQNVVNDNDPQNTADGDEIVPRGAISYGLDGDFKGVGGDVDVFNPGSIQGNVSQDTTGDGSGDTPIADVTLTLLDSKGNTITTTTDASGNYIFDNLLPGNYTVVQDQPPGLESFSENEGGADNDGSPTQSTLLNNQISATVSPEENDLTNDFVEATTAPTLYKLGNRVWNDENQNGSIDGSEPGIADVTVNLLDSSGNAIATTTTDANGYYLFSEIPAGDYVVEIAPDNFNAGEVLENLVSSTTDETNPNDDTDSNDNGLGRTPDPTNGIRSGTITLGTGTSEPTGETDVAPTGDTNDPDNQANLTVDFGMFEPTRVGDTVFNDTNLNGIQDPGETGVPNVTVTLTGGDGDGIGTGTDSAVTTTTDENGNYSFEIDDPNPTEQYQVTFDPGTLPTGASFTTANAGGDDNVDSDADISSGNTPIFNVSPGVNDLSLDAGIVQVATIGDTVFNDSDLDGIQDAGEPGIPGVTVTLTTGGADNLISTSGDNQTFPTTTTNGNGNYSFEISNPNPNQEYQVSFDISNLPAGSEFTTTNAGSDDNFDSDANSSGVTSIFNVASGENNLSLDAGVIQPASLGDTVFNDTDGDGIQDQGELGVPDVEVTLTGGGSDGIINGVNDTTVTDTTDGSGNYSFNNLNPGEEYQVTFDGNTLPTGTIFTDTDAGSDDTVDSDADSSGVTPVVILDSNENNTSIDAGIVTPASLGDKVFYDFNADGIQDVGESGVEGVSVTLTGGGADKVIGTGGDDTTVTIATDSNGEYSFTNLDPGEEYQVSFDASGLLPTTEFTTADAGTNDTVDSDVDSSGIAPVITLTSGENNDSIDAGLVIVNTDYGDAPDTTTGTGIGDYQTTEANEGASHTIVNGLSIGAMVDADNGTLENPAADADGEDEDGVTFTEVAGTTINSNDGDNSYSVDVIVNASHFATDDFESGDYTNGRGQWNSGWVETGFENSTDPNAGRIQIVNVGGNNILQYQNDSTTISRQFDFSNRTGDGTLTFNYSQQSLAANQSYLVLVSDGQGATPVSFEIDNTAPEGNTANGLATLTIPQNLLTSTTTISITQGPNGNTMENTEFLYIDNININAPGVPDTTLVGWIDFNRDGDFLDLGERVTKSTTDAVDPLIVDGVTPNTIEWQGFRNQITTEGDTYARFRLSTDSASIQNATGAAPDGEVEDYQLTIATLYNISGTVLSDTNNPALDAIDNPGDTAIGGVELTLYAASDATFSDPLDTATTDATSGIYEFTDIPNGNYVVVQTQPTDFDSVTDSDGAPDNQISVTVNNDDSTDNDFLEEKVVSIGSTVFRDANNNGIQDAGETGISGVDVELYDPGADGVVGGSDDTLVGSQPTNNDGNYFFDNLVEGNYYVSIPESNFNAGEALEGTPLSSTTTETTDNQVDGDDNGIQANSGDATNSPVINLTANSEPDNSIETAPDGNLDDGAGETDGDMTVDFGFTSVFTVSGTVLEDTFEPANDAINPGDTPITESVTLELFAADGNGDPTGNAIASTTTNNGFYEFPNIGNGDYVVVQTQPTGFNSVTDSDGAPDNQIAVNVNDGDSTGNNFLEERPAGSVSGSVIDQTSGNGINNVTLNLINNDGQIVDTVTTNNTGDYTFDYVLPGDYTVQQVQPFGYNSVSEVEGGTDDDNPGNDNTVNNRISVTVGLNDADNGNDVGNDFIEIQARDYGDAPDSQPGTGAGNYQTREADNGASHNVTSGLRIGDNLDTDSGTLQNTTATADDNSAVIDDEDGVNFGSNLQTDDTTYSVDVSVTNNTNQDATLVGWIDFDRNGSFDADEAVSRTIAANSGTTSVPLTWDNDAGNNGDLPGTGALAGDSIETGTTYSRFRLSSDPTFTANPVSTGTVSNGEVEDHQFDIGSSGAGGGLTTPDCVFIGEENVELTVTFDNTGAIPGYGPFVLLYLDKTGADGAGAEIDDGLTFKTAQYLGADVIQTEYTFDNNGEAQVTIGNRVETITAPPGFEPGDTVVYMELPFGSFVPDQPPADINVTVDVSDLADNNAPLNILSQTGYKFGEDPLDNPDSDPIILEDISAKPNEAITPELVKITNNYLGPEDETATGPNFVQQYQIVVDIAPGQTLTNLDVSDLLPDTMQFVDVASIEVADSGAGGVNNGVTISDISTPDDGGLTSIGSTNTTENDVNSDGEPTPGGTLTRRFSSVTGGDGENDIVITVDFFVPRLDAQGDVIINANSGDDVFDQNQAQLGDNDTLDGNNIWTANDTRDGDAEVYIDPTINDDPADPVDPTTTKPDGTTDTGLNGSNESDAGDDCNDPDHVLEEQSIAIQKGVTNTTDSGNSPGDVLEYTLNFQVSDYFAFQDIIVTDTFSDGQRFDTTFTPVVSISEHGTNTNNLDFTFNNYNPGGVSNSSGSETLIIDETDIDNVDDGSGNTLLTFNVSDELIASGLDGQLIGGGVPQGGFQDPANLNNNPPLPNDGTVGTITFRTIIQDAYSDNFPSGDPSLDQNDVLINDAIIDGAVLDVLDPNPNNGTEDALTPTGLREDDDTNAEITIEEGNLFKSIYAVNGVIAPGADTDNDLSDGLDGYDALTEVAPGDEITYRLTYQLPISDVEELQFTDFFPLPVFDVGTEFANPTFSTTFDPNGTAVPAAGETHYGRLDTFHQITGAPVPNLSLNAGANSLNYFYGDFDDPNNNASVVDLLVTVTTENDPFADNLLLTNQVRQSQENTFNEVSTRDAIIQITLREPVLEIKKGVVAFSSDNTDINLVADPAAPADITFTPGTAPTFTGDGIVSSSDLDTAPIDSNLTGGLEAGDVVTFAIAVENTGGSRKGAFDVRIQDILPDGFEIPAGGLNLNVTDGTGEILTYTGLGDPQGVGDDLFGNGIELIDPGATPANGTGLAAETDAGAIDGYILDSNDNQTNPGRNVAIISYDLQVTTPSPYVDPATLENTARVVSYSNLEGGESFPSINDNATVEIERPEATKSIVTTSEADTSEAGDGSNNANAREVTIGEIVRYRLVAEIPEGNAVNFILRDRLPNGQTFLNDGTSTVAFVSNGDGISSSNPNGSTLNLGLGTAPANTGNSPGDANNFVTLGDNAIGSNNGITTNADNYNTGTDVRFKLGDIINSDRDADDEFIVIEFNALIDNNNLSNNRRNDAGEFKSNNFQIISDGVILDTSDNVRVEIVEPVIDDVEQTVSLDGTNFSESVNADSQDTVTFQVTFSNTGNSTAYDVDLTDNLPAGLENFTFDPNDVTLSNGAAGAVVNPNPNPDNELDLIIDAIPVNGSVAVTYTAQVVNGVAPDLTITNTADVSYTSLPGTGTTSNPTGSDTPGASGAVNGERDGSDGEGVNPNDYADSDPADVNTLPLDPIKSLVTTSEASTGTNEGASTTDFDLTIGEIARYRMVVQIPEGNTNNLQITDLLPPGLRYLDDGTSQIALISDGGLSSDTITDSDPASPNLASNNPNVTPEFDITASDSADTNTTFESGEDPTFSIGNLTNTDSDANSELVVIEFNALVENITANQDPGTLDNSFTVDADNATARTSNIITIDLVEPVIDNVEQTVSLDGNNFSESVNADSQDTVTFQVTFSNTGNNTAFDVDLSDTLPAGELENLSVTDITSSPGVTGVTNNSNATDLDLIIDTIPVGGSVTVTYTAQVADGVAPDLTVTNTADVTYTSLPGTGTISNPTGSDTPGASGAINGERNGSDGATGSPNDYADSDPADVTINSYSIGSTVFEDIDNDGIQEPANENGIQGVVVRLFDSTGTTEIPVGPDGILGTADDAAGGVQTDIDGNYLFTGLEPGNYQITIPDSNFAPGGALENASLSSIPTDTADNGQDGDDNGIQTGGLGTEVVSPVIELSAGDEPTTAETLPGGDLDDALNDANGDMTVDFGFVPKNIVTGTGGSDVISPSTTNGTTAGNDFIIGGAGQDTLTGGAGNDCFHFNRTSDGIDIITDFSEGDVLDFSDMFAPGGELAGVTITNDPITDGYVEVVDANPSTLIQVDFDPNDALFNKNVVLLENVDSSTIDASDFIF